MNQLHRFNDLIDFQLVSWLPNFNDRAFASRNSPASGGNGAFSAGYNHSFAFARTRERALLAWSELENLVGLELAPVGQLTFTFS
jgi:hypothetical protein